jgi:uncharacterized HhH-GPD family protein
MPAPAKDLYVSPLWEKRRAYAESTGVPWAVLSAQHGLVMPDELIGPYDRALKKESIPSRQRWAAVTLPSVLELCHSLSVSDVEVHAGKAYLEHGLVGGLNQAGVHVYWPLRNKRIGEQLEWYDRRLEATPGPGGSQADPPSLVAASPGLPVGRPLPMLLHLSRLDAFSFRWPDSVEDFEYGWEGEVEWDGRRHRVRHGVGRRVVYAQQRPHTVTWLDGAPTVEGVGADDFSDSHALLSLIKAADGSMVRDVAVVSPGYAAFEVVEFRREIDAPYSRRGLAVKIRIDDFPAWAHHALLRNRGMGGATTSSSPSVLPDSDKGVLVVEPPESLGSVEQAYEPISDQRKLSIASGLVQFGETAISERARSPLLDFTYDPAANQLLVDDPFAFLIAVISDQGVKAERAWMVPIELTRRMGHLDPVRMLDEPEEVYRAFKEPTSLHRYVETIPAWVLAAASQVLTVYGGDAAAIWNDEPTAVVLQERLRAFDGIGQKKAAMAVEILERDIGVPILSMEGSDIAYDVHVRRVFLRTGLAERDDVDHMVEVARRVFPDRPGALDAPAWIIGRTWCRPGTPDCPACVLVEVCARRIELGDQVRGA